MPKAFFWVAMSTKGESGVHCAFDVNAEALAHVRAHPTAGVVLLGGKTLDDAAAKCFGRLAAATPIPVKCTLPRNFRLPKVIRVPARGPVTVEEKRKERAQRKATITGAPAPASTTMTQTRVAGLDEVPVAQTAEDLAKAARLAKDMRRFERKIAAKAAVEKEAALKGSDTRGGDSDLKRKRADASTEAATAIDAVERKKARKEKKEKKDKKEKKERERSEED